jgi:hypothetical protein
VKNAGQLGCSIVFGIVWPPIILSGKP